LIRLHLPELQSPYFYAAAEEWLVRNYDKRENLIFFYVNEPCVVIGKNQSVWLEVNASYIHDATKTIVRRVSGGGTVYHDSGNLCFGIISPFEEFKVNNYRYFNEPIVAALNKMDIAVDYSSRNDLLFGGKKVSGNAQFTNRKNILSHGTLLYNADLIALRQALKANEYQIETKAVSSVRSEVCNLCDFYTGDFNDFCSSLQNNINFSETMTLAQNEIAEIEILMKEKYMIAEWIIGKSPKTLIQTEVASWSINNGIFELINSQRFEDEIKILNGVLFETNALKAKMSTLGFSVDIQQKISEILFSD
jgi:lipoate---protein ligase